MLSALGVPEASQTQPPDHTLRSLPTLPASAPASRGSRSPRPGIPQQLVLGGRGSRARGSRRACSLGVAAAAAGGASARPRAAARPRGGCQPAARPAKQAVATSGTLRVASEPAGARVLVDGRARGRSPLELAELAFGSYEVRVEQPGYEPERGASSSAPARRRPSCGSCSSSGRRPALGRRLRLDARGRVGQRRRQAGGPNAAARLQAPAWASDRWRWRSTVTRRGRARSTSRPATRPASKCACASAPRRRPCLAGRRDARVPERDGAGGHARAQAEGRLALVSVRPRAALKSGQRVSVLVRFVVTDAGDVTDVVVSSRWAS